MIKHWSNLNEREQLTISIGGVLTLIYLSYLLIYSPIHSSLVTKAKILKENQTTLRWMQEVRQQRSNLNEKKSITNNKLLTLIATELNNDYFQKFTHQIQQTTQGDIELGFENIPYLPFLEWLWKLENNYTIFLKQLTIKRTNTAGVVKINLVIRTKAL